MIRSLLFLTTLSLTVVGATPAPEQAPPAASPAKEPVRAALSAAEAGTPEALVASLYAFISGPKGQKRNVEKIRALFDPSARILWVGHQPKEGAFFRMIELEPFLGAAVPGWEQGFFEQGAPGITVLKWEGMAQVWTPYTIRRTADGAVEYTGINALQCAWDGKRWWITHLEFGNQAAATEGAPKP